MMRMRFASSIAIAALALSACSGPSAVMPLPSGRTTAPSSIARFTITVPSAVHALSVGRTPQYVSASTQSISIAVDGAANPTIANLSASSPGCATPAGAALNCKLSVVAPVGSDTFRVVTYDRANGSGKALSEASISATITANHLNNIGLILNGIVASIQLTLSNPAPRQGAALSIGLTVDALDADGNVIIGPGTYNNGPIALTNTDASGTTSLSTPNLGDPSATVKVAYNGQTIPGGSATFSASAAGVPASAVKSATLTPTASQQKWTTVGPMAAARGLLAAGGINGVMYAVGGSDSGGNVLSTVAAYDPSTNLWSVKAPMPTARYGLATGVINGVLYAVGGCGASGFLSTVEAYDPATNTWSAKASMPTVRCYLAAGVVNGILYAVGGFNHSGYLNTVEAYNPATNAWTTKAAMPTARYAPAAGVINGLLYAMGGLKDGKSSYVTLATVDAYDPSANAWVTKAPMPAPSYFLAAAVIGGSMYAMGGINSSGALGSVNAYDPATNAWSAKPALSVARLNLAVGVVGNTMYAVGGYDNYNVPLAINESFTP